MKNLNKNSSATDFVSDLNSNFFGEHTIKMQMQAGPIAITNGTGDTIAKNNIAGYPAVTTNDSEFFSTCHTVQLLGIKACNIVSIEVPKLEALSIFCYGANGSYIGYVSDIENIFEDTEFVRFMLSRSGTAYSSIPTLEVTVDGHSKLLKNTTYGLVTERYFSFETTMPSQYDTDVNDPEEDAGASAGQYIGVNNSARYFDNGWIKLPPNYSAEGAPVPLVVNIHGSNGFDFMKGPKPLGYDVFQSFIANNGYAICDCSGVTNLALRRIVSDQFDDAFFSPSFISCIRDLVNYAIANYNISADGVYLIGKSAGGYILHLMTVMQGLKIRAAASLAPGISPLSAMQFYLSSLYNNIDTTRFAFTQLGISDNPTGVWASHDKAIVLNNIHKLRQIDCLFMGTDLSDEQVTTIVTESYNDSSSESNFDNTKKDFTGTAACMAILNNTRIHVPVPTKIWVASDDAAVPYTMAKLYVEMAQRAGSPVYLRRMPSGKGGHHVVDTDDKAPKVTYQTKYGDAVSIPVAYAEAVDWFNRW